MWVVKDKTGFIHMFNNKPARKENSYWSDSINNIENCITVSDEFIKQQFDNNNLEDEPIEVLVLPKPTIENVYINPIYKSIMDLGKDDLIRYSDIVKESDNKIADNLHIVKRPHSCRNNGHPYCFDGIRCSTCKNWHFDIFNYISKYVGSKR